MTIDHIRRFSRIALISSILGLASAGPAVAAREKLKCGTWSTEMVELAVTEHLQRRLKAMPNHPIAAPFFKAHVFHREQFRYEEYADGIWVVPFTLPDAWRGRPETYDASVTCEKSVEFHGYPAASG